MLHEFRNILPAILEQLDTHGYFVFRRLLRETRYETESITGYGLPADLLRFRPVGPQFPTIHNRCANLVH